MQPIKVYLRGLEIEDAEKIYEWRKNYDLFEYYRSHIKYVSSLNEKNWVEERIKDKENVSCAICLKDDHTFIGCTFLTSIDLVNRSARGSTFIGSIEHRGKGYGVQGRILILHHAFYDWGLERVWAHVHENNVSSIKMHEKCGYKIEGLLRNASFKNGTFQNVYVMAVLKEDFDLIIKNYSY